MFNVSPQQAPNSDPVPFLKNGERYREIADKLCEKRKALEWNLINREPQAKEEYALELMRLKESMRTFGITEIDYQAYLEKKKQEIH
jgi:hypothetical protein